jgi:hypothetical protein
LTFRRGVRAVEQWLSLGFHAGRRLPKRLPAFSGEITQNIGVRLHLAAAVACVMNGGRDNLIDNNLFAECEKGITGNYDAKNEQWKGLGRHPAFIMSELYLKRYPGLQRLHENRRGGSLDR